MTKTNIKNTDLNKDGIPDFKIDIPSDNMFLDSDFLIKRGLNVIMDGYEACVRNYGKDHINSKKILFTARKAARARQWLIEGKGYDLGQNLEEMDLDKTDELVEKIKTFLPARQGIIVFENSPNKENIIYDPTTEKFIEAYRDNNTIIFENPGARDESLKIEDWNLMNAPNVTRTRWYSDCMTVFQHGFGNLLPASEGNKYRTEMNMYLNFGQEIGELGGKPTNFMKVKVNLFNETAIYMAALEGQTIPKSYLNRLDRSLREKILDNPLE